MDERTVSLRRLVQQSRLVRECLVDLLNHPRDGRIDVGRGFDGFDGAYRICPYISTSLSSERYSRFAGWSLGGGLNGRTAVGDLTP